MTIKQIFDILETYNECCYLCHEPSNCKTIEFDDDGVITETFTRYYEFVDTVSQWYRPAYLDSLLTCDSFIPGQGAELTWIDKYGNKHVNGRLKISFMNRY